MPRASVLIQSELRLYLSVFHQFYSCNPASTSLKNALENTLENTLGLILDSLIT